MTNIGGIDVPTPELDKETAAKEKGAQKIGNFIEWLIHESPYIICKETDHIDADYTAKYVPAHKGPKALLAEYFGIDLQKCEQERKAILEAWQKSQGYT
jgi:hypothetical protein